MKFLIDECTLGKTRNLLQGLGFSTISVVELGKASATNGEILNLAKAHKAILIASDLDFSNLTLYPLGTHTGIIVLRTRSETPETLDAVHEILKRALNEIGPSVLEKSLLIVDHNKYRIKKREE